MNGKPTHKKDCAVNLIGFENVSLNNSKMMNQGKD